jgi:hypothetical protein
MMSCVHRPMDPQRWQTKSSEPKVVCGNEEWLRMSAKGTRAVGR